jgi:hypothetical protein
LIIDSFTLSRMPAAAFLGCYALASMVAPLTLPLFANPSPVG